MLSLVGCGSRTGLDVAASAAAIAPSDAGSNADAGNATCANADRPWLLFELDGTTSLELYAMRSDGTEGHVLALAHSAPLYASLTNDGTKLLYVTFEDETDGGDVGTLYLEDLDHGTATRILSGPSPSYSALSSEGNSLVYTLGYDVHVIDVTGNDDRVLLQHPADAPWGYGHPVIVGSSDTFLFGFGGAFGSIHLDGSADTTLVDDGNGFDYPNPAVAPDLANVVSALQCPDDMLPSLRVFSYASLPAACDSGRKLAPTQGYSSAPNAAADPAWGPTGLIAYADAKDVYVVDPAGGAPRNMTATLTAGLSNGGAFDPLWAPGCAPIP